MGIEPTLSAWEADGLPPVQQGVGAGGDFPPGGWEEHSLEAYDEESLCTSCLGKRMAYSLLSEASVLETTAYLVELG